MAVAALLALSWKASVAALFSTYSIPHIPIVQKSKIKSELDVNASYYFTENPTINNLELYLPFSCLKQIL